MSDPRYYTELAAAFVRGKLGCAGAEPDALIERGRSEGLRMHEFKRTGLQRVVKCIGILKGLGPSELLDIGSGRGTFLWPLLDAIPWIGVTAVDIEERRVEAINAVRRGGIERVEAYQQSVLALDFEADAFDVVTALEVLEHLERPQAAARELVRVGRRFIVASVPSKPDNNPQHIQLFTEDTFPPLFLEAGARRVQLDYVLNHMIAVVSL